jgi:RNA polymerase sigma factor (sigma-70 family)
MSDDEKHPVDFVEGTSGTASDTIDRLVGRRHDGETTPSVLRVADRVLRRAEPTARAACHGEARGMPAARIEELVQDTLECVWAKLDEFDSDIASFEAWVRGIARNVCRNATRKKRDLLTEDGVLEATDPAHGVLRGLERKQREALVYAAIESSLDGIEQDVLYHRYLHGLEREKIAELMGFEDADRVRKVLFTATRRLRRELHRRLEALGHGMSLLRSDER